MARQFLVVTGDKQLTRQLNALGGPKAKEFHRKASRKAAKPILDKAKQVVSAKTGRLRKSLTIRAAKRSRKSIGVRVTQREGAFKGDAFYGGFQEMGWRPGKRSRQSRRKRGRDERTRKVPGKWQMRQAGTEAEGKAVQVYESEVKTLIDTVT